MSTHIRSSVKSCVASTDRRGRRSMRVAGGAWKAIAKFRTNPNATLKKKVGDRPGTYRAVAPAFQTDKGFVGSRTGLIANATTTSALALDG